MSIDHDLSMFDKEPKKLVLRMLAAGWQGRMTTDNHFDAYSPDDEPTRIVVYPRHDNGHGFKNTKNRFETWLRRREKEAKPPILSPAVDEPAPAPEPIQPAMEESVTATEPFLVNVSPGLSRASGSRKHGTMYIPIVKFPDEMPIPTVVHAVDTYTGPGIPIVVKHEFSDGSIRFYCAFCDLWFDDSHRCSVHYGGKHKRGQGFPEAEVGPSVIDRSYITDEVSREAPKKASKPAAVNPALEPQEAVSVAPVLPVGVPEDPEPVTLVIHPDGSGDILEQIKRLVAPDLYAEIEVLKAALSAVREQLANYEAAAELFAAVKRGGE